MGALGQILRPIVALALPPRCPACASVVEDDHRFCADCWARLDFLGDPACAGCGVPFELDRGPSARCAHCLADPPPHDGVRAAVAYGEVARIVALRLKYSRRLAAAETMARLMVRNMPSGADLIVPVPLHRRRIWSRGFNQAALIGSAIGGIAGVVADPFALVRVKATPVLRGLDHKGRRRAVAGAFAVSDAAMSRIAGKSVVLIDDVHTSGATVNGCARVLKRAGAERVTILCWARVIDGDGGGSD